MAQPEHIPAWKKLGLKLKSSGEDTGTVSHASPALNGVKNQAHNLQAANGVSMERRNGEHLSKRRRLAEDSKPSTVNASSLLNGHAQPNGQTRAGSPVTTSNAAKLKKKVSFSNDTKKYEGDTPSTNSTTEIVNGVNTKSQSNGVQAVDLASVSSNPKRKKQSKSAKFSSSNSGSPKASNVLSYLDDFYSKSPSWKFNKNRETWILKHALSTSDIPTSHNLKLVHYIHGLKSQGARARLAVSCREALSVDEENEEQQDSETDSIWRGQLQNELSSTNQNNTNDSSTANMSYQEWITKQPRAKLLLWSLDPSTINESLATKSIPKSHIGIENTTPNGGHSAQVEARPKKRKNRTAVIEYSSSSESSSESSSSDDEDDDDSDNDHVGTKGLKHNNNESESSSGGGSDETSTDSSSESDG